MQLTTVFLWLFALLLMLGTSLARAQDDMADRHKLADVISELNQLQVGPRQAQIVKVSNIVYDAYSGDSKTYWRNLNDAIDALDSLAAANSKFTQTYLDESAKLKAIAANFGKVPGFVLTGDILQEINLERPTVVFVTVAGCEICDKISVMLAKVQESNFEILMIDKDAESKVLSSKIRTKIYPTLIVYRKGKELNRNYGDLKEGVDIREFVRKSVNFHRSIQDSFPPNYH